MKIDGFQLHQLIREARADRDQAQNQFNPSLTAFPGESKPDPLELACQLQEAEERLARLQAVQARFNLELQVVVAGRVMSLLQAIKQVGGISRLEQLWRKAADPTPAKVHYGPEPVRKSDDIVLERRISYDAASEQAKLISKQAALLRAAIAKGNSQDVDLSMEATFLKDCISRSQS